MSTRLEEEGGEVVFLVDEAVIKRRKPETVFLMHWCSCGVFWGLWGCRGVYGKV